MARRILIGLCAALLATPTALAFFSGGFFDEPRLWAALAMWAGLALATALGARPLPASRSGRACVGGLAGLTTLTAASIAWAPVRDSALADTERLALYLGALLAGLALLRERRARRALEPALAAGIVVVVGYGLAGRLLPELIEAERSAGAGTRLDQPLTYWNAMGVLAAMGAVLALRVASDPSRDRRLRAAAAGATPALLLGLYLTLSRGALAALAVGLVALVVLAGVRRTAGSALVALVAGGLAVAVVTRFPAVETLGAGDGSAQGLAMLAVLLALVAAAALAQARLASAEGAGSPQLGRRTARFAAGLLAVAACAIALATLVPAAQDESAPSPRIDSAEPGALPEDRGRLRTLETNRLAYWDLALGAAGEAPLQGHGSGSFAALWLERRTVEEGVRDAHSLYIETLFELGLAGLCLLALFVAGVVAAARALRASGAEGRDLSAGWLAAGLVFLVHAGLDWDWEMPAVGLVFVLLVAGTVAAREALDPALYHKRERAQIGGRGAVAGTRRQRRW